MTTPEQCRTFFPVCERKIYLNNAGVAPTSTSVRRAATEWFDAMVERGFDDPDSWERRLDQTRANAARLLGCDADEVAFVRSTSHGLGLVAEGIDWQPGDEIAVCAEVEYPSNVYPWLHLEQTRGVKVRNVEAVRGGVVLAEVQAALTDRTRLVTVSAVQYATGHATDLDAIGALCKDRGVLFCVDGIQRLGAFDIDVRRSNIDFLSADSHKWMLGLVGTGVMYVRREVLPSLRPVLVGWKSTTDAFNFDRVHFELRKDAAKLEEGTLAIPMIYGMNAGIEMILDVGMDAVSGHIRELLAYAERRLVDAGLEVSPAPSERAGILMVSPVGDPQSVLQRCIDRNIEVSLRRGRLRIAPHVYNNRADIDAFVDAVLPQR